MDRVKTRSSFSANLKDLKKRVPLIAIERVEESFPELWQQGYVKFENSQNRKKNEENFNETVCRKLPKKESVAASEMWNMALKENRYRKWKEPHTCPFCGKCTQSRWSLRRHIQVLQPNGHTQNSALRHCSICGKSFFSAFALRSHIAMHNLQCKVCKKQFTKLGDLNLHSKSHSQQLSYRCEKCSKRFASKNDLEQHSFVHSSVKPFSCRVCKMQFTSKHSLNIHKKQHEVATCQSDNYKWRVIIHSWPRTASWNNIVM